MMRGLSSSSVGPVVCMAMLCLVKIYISAVVCVANFLPPCSIADAGMILTTILTTAKKTPQKVDPTKMLQSLSTGSHYNESTEILVAIMVSYQRTVMGFFYFTTASVCILASLVQNAKCNAIKQNVSELCTILSLLRARGTYVSHFRWALIEMLKNSAKDRYLL